MMLSLTASCAETDAAIESADFCDIAERHETTREVALFILKRDRPFIEGLNVHNKLVDGCEAEAPQEELPAKSLEAADTDKPAQE